MAGSNERTNLPRLDAVPLNLSAAQQEEMQTMGYLLRLVATLPGIDAETGHRLRTMAHFFELETEQAKRIYKHARQRAIDERRLAQVRRGIVTVTTGELDLVRNSMGLGDD